MFSTKHAQNPELSIKKKRIQYKKSTYYHTNVKQH